MIDTSTGPCAHRWTRLENRSGGLIPAWQCTRCTRTHLMGEGHDCSVCGKPSPHKHRETCSRECNGQLRKAWGAMKRLGLKAREVAHADAR